MADEIQQVVQEIKAQIEGARTRTARGKVTAVNGGEVEFQVGGSTVVRKGRWSGPSQPQVGDVITYVDEGRGYPLVVGTTGPKDLHVVSGQAIHVGAGVSITDGQVNAGSTTVDSSGVSVGSTEVSSGGVSTSGSFTDGQGDLRTAISSVKVTADNLQVRVNSNGSAISTLQSQVSNLQSQVNNLQSQINNLTTRLNDNDAWAQNYVNPNLQNILWVLSNIVYPFRDRYNAHTSHPPNDAPV